MPITVRDKQYVLALGDSLDGVLEPQIEVTQKPAIVDIPKNTRMALGHWLSDVTTGRAGYKANITPITDESVTETQLSSQPITLTGQASISAIPRSTSDLESLVELNGETLRSAPESVASYVISTVRSNSASSDLTLSSIPIQIGNQRFDTRKTFNVGPLLTARASQIAGASIDDFDPQKSVGFSTDQLFAIRRSVS